jgi:hypothetical protein
MKLSDLGLQTECSWDGNDPWLVLDRRYLIGEAAIDHDGVAIECTCSRGNSVMLTDFIFIEIRHSKFNQLSEEEKKARAARLFGG